MPPTAPPGGRDPNQQVGVEPARQQQQGAERDLQRAEHNPTERPAVPLSLLGSEPAQDPQQACQHRSDTQQPDEHVRVDQPGETIAKQHQPSPAPTTAALAAANPSRNPGRGRMARRSGA